MAVLSRDTELSAERVRIEVLAAMSPSRKIGLVVDACETNRTLLLAGLRARNPAADKAELHRLLLSLQHGEETAARVCARLAAAEE
jgi:hypothetical protein